MKRLIIALSLSVMLSACAVYQYDRTADNICSLSVVSFRSVDQAILSIDDDCALAASVGQLDSSKALDVLGGIVEKLPR